MALADLFKCEHKKTQKVIWKDKLLLFLIFEWGQKGYLLQMSLD